MVAKKRNFDMKTILTVMIVALVVLAVVYIVLTPSEEPEDVLSVEELLLNKDNHAGKTRTVEGIYRKQGSLDTLNSPTTDAEPISKNYVFLDLSNINLTETPAVEGDKYRVKGKVEVTIEGSATQTQIIADSFTKV